MDPVNFLQPEWDLDQPDPPVANRAMRLGPRAGARDLGATLYEIGPGGAVSPYHAHHANEELLLVLEGEPSVRTPTGMHGLRPGSVMAFPAGLDGAHRVVNLTDAPARVIMVSTMRLPEVAEHLDSGTTIALTGPATGSAFPGGSSEDVVELWVMAMRMGVDEDGRVLRQETDELP